MKKTEKKKTQTRRYVLEPKTKRSRGGRERGVVRLCEPGKVSAGLFPKVQKKHQQVDEVSTKSSCINNMEYFDVRKFEITIHLVSREV